MDKLLKQFNYGEVELKDGDLKKALFKGYRYYMALKDKKEKNV